MAPSIFTTRISEVVSTTSKSITSKSTTSKSTSTPLTKEATPVSVQQVTLAPTSTLSRAQLATSHSNTILSSTTHLSSSSSSPNRTAIFETPALTTIFTPPPECTQAHLTMLESDAYRIWMNEPLPVANTTFSACYPRQFMTSYLEEKSNTAVPPFSPLVCPDNYHTVFSQSFTDRPLYVACCPQSYTLASPSISTPGRPAYGGTCYSNIMTVSVTQYDNSSSSGVTLFAPTATTNQAFAHPIDGFAMAAATTSVEPTVIAASPVASPHPTTQYSPGIISGVAIAGVVAIVAVLTGIMLCLRIRRRKQDRQVRFGMEPSTPIDEKTLIAFPYGNPDKDRKVAEMHASLEWVPELPLKRPQSANPLDLNSAPQELPTIISPKIPQSPEPVLVPPPRSPNRDILKYDAQALASPLSMHSPTKPPPLFTGRSGSQYPRQQIARYSSKRSPASSAMERTPTNRSSSSGSSGISRDSPMTPPTWASAHEPLSPISPREPQPGWI